MGRPRSVLWMEIDEWKKQAASTTPPTNEYCLQKVSTDIQAKQVEGIDRAIKFVVSRATVDRDNDTINQNGWLLESFLKNPVVPFAHDYRALPVARSISTAVIGGDLIGTAQFVSREIYPFADTVYQMLMQGFLNAVSVGFRPKAHELNKERGGVDFLQQELLEYSVVPVPSNPEALVEARSVGINVEPLKAWAEHVLDEYHEEAGIWLPKKTLEDMSWALTGKQTVVEAEVVDDAKDTTTQGATVATHVEEVDGEPPTPTDKDPEVVTVVKEDGALAEPEGESAAEENPLTLDMSPEEEIALELEDDIVPSTEPVQEPKDYSPDVSALSAVVSASYGTGAVSFGESGAVDIDPGTVINFDLNLMPSDGIVKDTVQKLDPLILNNPLPGSYQDTTNKLAESVPNFLTRNGKEFRQDADLALVVSTFNDHAIFCVIGKDRPFADDPCYRASFQINVELSLPQWIGTPKLVTTEISVNLVEQAAALLSWKDDETKSTVVAIEIHAAPSAQDEENGHSDFTDEDVKQSVEVVLKDALRSIGREVRDQTAEAIRHAQGRLD